MKKHTLDYAFTLLTAFFVFIFVKQTYGQVKWSLEPMVVVAALFFSVAAYLVQIKASHLWLSIKEQTMKTGYSEFSYMYLRGSLARYMPGNVWAYLLRYRYGQRLGISKDMLVISMLFEVYWFVLAAAAWSILLVSASGPIRWMIFLLALLVIHWLWNFYFPNIAGWWVKKFKLTLKNAVRDAWHSPKELTPVALYTILWLGWGLSLMIVSNHVAGDQVLSIVPATAIFAFSYLVGFLSFFTPSGLGVREATMIALLLPFMGVHLAGVVAIWSRIIYTLGEVAVYGLMCLWSVFAKKPV